MTLLGWNESIYQNCFDFKLSQYIFAYIQDIIGEQTRNIYIKLDTIMIGTKMKHEGKLANINVKVFSYVHM